MPNTSRKSLVHIHNGHSNVLNITPGYEEIEYIRSMIDLERDWNEEDRVMGGRVGGGVCP